MTSLPLRSIALSLAVVTASWIAACGDTTNAGGGGGGTPEGGGGSPSTGGAGASGGGGAGAAGGGGSTSDGGGGGGATICPDAYLDLPTDLPDLLSETGLYEDIASDTIASYVRPYAPKYALWSDAAEKRRFAYIPTECDLQIDTSDIDTWQMPVGSRFWKEFTRDGQKIETRLIVRTGPDDIDFKFATYVWDGDDAVRNDNGVDDPVGHNDVPPKTLCSGCHKRDWRILGFSAIQLSHDDTIPGETITTLSNEGVLTVPKPEGLFVPSDPDNPAVEPALGYLHANCGNCHYEGGVTNISMHLRVLSTMTTPADTDTYATAIGITTEMFTCPPDNMPCPRIDPGNAAGSAIIMRMSARPPNTDVSQMPPFATEVVDDTGVTTVSTWIDSL